MKKRILITLTVLLVVCLGLVACGKKGKKPTSNTSTESESVSVQGKENFTGISFNDITVDYDGEEHTITASGVPSFAQATYTNAGPFVNAGEYTIGVTVKADNYNDYTATATLKINKIDLTGVTFDDVEFEYDGNEHYIEVNGFVPSTATVEYSCEKDGITNGAIDVGEYEVTVVITDMNYNDFTATATLKIIGKDDVRIMAFTEGGELFFQNAIDDDKLYIYNPEDGSIEKVSNDIISDIVSYSDDTVIMISKTAFFSSIKSATVGIEEVSVQTVLSEKADYIQKDGDTLYYSINGLTQEKSGIFKADLSGDEPVITCLSSGKASYITLVENKIYFADGKNGNKLSVISTTQTNQNRILVVDEKINNLIYADGNLVYTVNNLAGNYIEKYNISGQKRVKLTIDAGESLTVIGNILYYVNVDKFTTTVIGKGIYSVNLSAIVNNNLPGKLVIEGSESGLCSLHSDGTDLYYYDVDGYKLIKYSISSKETENLLEGFTKPVPPTPISTGSKVVEYGGNIYYLDIWDEKTLHVYNPISKRDVRITTNKVTDFSIIGDVLYVSMVAFLTNNDIYSLNLKVGGELVKVSTLSGSEICSDGQWIYYVEQNLAGASTAVRRCKLDGSEDEVLYDKGVSNLRLAGDKLLFVDGSNIHVFDVSTKKSSTIKVGGREIHTDAFDTDGTYVYYRDMYGLAWKDKRLARCKIDGSEDVKIVDDGVDPIDIVYKDGFVYFYSDTISNANGLYKVSANCGESTNPTLILDGETYFAREFDFVGDDLYFVSYKNQLEGDAHLYVLKDGEQEPTLVR